MPDTKLIPGLPVVNADVTIGAGDGFFPKVEEISTADQTTVIGDGTTQRPLHSSGGGGGGVNLFQNETPLPGNPYTDINFQTPILAVDAGGVAQISILLAGLGIQSFRYVADGTETTAGFPITLQTARGDVNYNALVILLDTAEDFTVEQPPSGYATTHFTCIPGTNLTVGDVFAILIVPLT